MSQLFKCFLSRLVIAIKKMGTSGKTVISFGDSGAGRIHHSVQTHSLKSFDTDAAVCATTFCQAVLTLVLFL